MRVGSVRVAVAWAIALAIGEGGCAIITQQAPKENRAPGEAPVCSTGRGGVALDVVMAAALGAGALVALANDEPGVGLGFGAVGGIYGYSAVSGHRSAAACEEAIEDYQIELAARRSEPRGRPPAAPTQPAEGGGPIAARPAGPRLEEAAPPAPDDEAPPAEEEVVGSETASPPAPEPVPASSPAPSPRDWSDFWIEVTR